MNGQDGETVEARVRSIIGRREAADRTHLLPVLEEIQEAFGCVPQAAAEVVREAMGVPLADIYGLVTFYDLLSEEPKGAGTVLLCTDVPCWLRGSDALAEVLERHIGPEGAASEGGGASWRRYSCLGQCDRAPAALVDGGVVAPMDDRTARSLRGG